MRARFKITQQLVAIISMVLLSSSVFAQSRIPPEQESIQTYTQRSAEGLDLELEIGSNGRPIAVRVIECDGCQHTTFVPAPDIEFRVAGVKVTLSEAVSASGGAGVVLYHPETRLAEDVNFYGR